MKRCRTAVVLVFVVLLAVAGCDSGPLRVLEAGDTFTLYSIGENTFAPDDQRGMLESFHGFPVFGRITVGDAKQRTYIVNALQKGLKASDGRIGDGFKPKHAIRVTYGNRKIDCLVCFESTQIQLRENGETKIWGTTGYPKPILDSCLANAGVPVDPPFSPIPDSR
jgi:hypothetical protein